MKKPLQLELFRDGARAIAAATKRPKPTPATEQDLEAKLAAARQRLREIVVLSLKTWVPEESRKGLGEAEAWRREMVRMHHKVLERFRAQQRRGTDCCGDA
jgi:hypothetical protein